MPKIARVFAENFAVYGVRKIWRQMTHEGVSDRQPHRRTANTREGFADVIRGKIAAAAAEGQYYAATDKTDMAV